MSISTVESAFIASAGEKISLASIFSTSASTSNPTYLVLTGLDRNEYTAGAGDTTGSLSGNGASDSFSNDGGDARSIGIVFTYQTSTGRYYNSTYGYLDQLSYTASTSNGDVTNLSLYGTNSLSLANTYSNNAVAAAQLDVSGYLGSATVVTQSNFTGTVPAQATPDSISTIAESFVGKAWNMNGCWVLASTIAAEAGTSLPLVSSLTGVAGQANGEWIVAFNGSKQSGNWESMVTAGEMIVIANGSSGHITTCVSGSGSSAMLVDNITYVNNNGTIANAAGDGSSSDVLISAPHSATQEWAGVISSDVVIYELDTPIVTDLVSIEKLSISGKQVLSQLFSAKDPGTKTVTEYQVYNSSSADTLSVSGVSEAAHSAASAITVNSLSLVTLQAGSSAGTDTIEVRAYNGSYWGDWETLPVSVAAAPTAPTVTSQTAAQAWTTGQHVSLTLASNTFTDPNGEALKLSATQSNGTALPSWLTFSASTDTFTGTVPSGTSNLSLKVTATDTSNLSTSETISVSISAPLTSTVTSLSLATQTPNQSWSDGQKVAFTLPANTFSIPQNLHVTYLAYALSGLQVTSWLTFNSTTETFAGTVPNNVSGVANIEVVAVASNGMAAIDMFSVTVGKTGTTTSLVGVMTADMHGPQAIHG